MVGIVSPAFLASLTSQKNFTKRDEWGLCGPKPLSAMTGVMALRASFKQALLHLVAGTF